MTPSRRPCHWNEPEVSAVARRVSSLAPAAVPPHAHVVEVCVCVLDAAFLVNAQSFSFEQAALLA